MERTRQVPEEALILRHQAPVKKEPGRHLLEAICLQSRCPRPRTLIFSMLTAKCSAGSLTEGSCRGTGTCISFQLQSMTGNQPTEQADQKQNLGCFQICFLLKCYSNIKEKHVCPTVLLLADLFSARVTCKSGVQRAGNRCLALGPCQRDAITRIMCNEHTIIYPTVISIAKVH